MSNEDDLFSALYQYCEDDDEDHEDYKEFDGYEDALYDDNEDEFDYLDHMPSYDEIKASCRRLKAKEAKETLNREDGTTFKTKKQRSEVISQPRKPNQQLKRKPESPMESDRRKTKHQYHISSQLDEAPLPQVYRNHVWIRDNQSSTQPLSSTIATRIQELRHQILELKRELQLQEQLAELQQSTSSLQISEFGQIKNKKTLKKSRRLARKRNQRIEAMKSHQSTPTQFVMLNNPSITTTTCTGTTNLMKIHVALPPYHHN